MSGTRTPVPQAEDPGVKETYIFTLVVSRGGLLLIMLSDAHLMNRITGKTFIIPESFNFNRGSDSRRCHNYGPLPLTLSPEIEGGRHRRNGEGLQENKENRKK